MRAELDIINRLLDKYENSKHLTHPGTSNRRVMLSNLKKDLPAYDYENAAVRDTYNAAAKELEREKLITLEWLDNSPVMTCIWLNLEMLSQSYTLAGRTHPADRAKEAVRMISESLKDVTVPWIKEWEKETCAKAEEDFKLPSFCKNSSKLLKDLLTAFSEYDALQGSVTMRAFSSKCYHDTKYFERNIRKIFLGIACQYDETLSNACSESQLSERDQQAILGIYARPELYELAGNCVLETKWGKIDLGAAPCSGLAIPSTLVDEICSVDYKNINCITFIENKTNYDEYLLSERSEHELLVYHGGFMSPQKQKFFTSLVSFTPLEAPVRFWADIDLGGFQMFYQMLETIPRLLPMRMDAAYIEKYHSTGLARSEEYLAKLQVAFDSNEYPIFSDSIAAILKYGVTVEQEAFLN